MNATHEPKTTGPMAVTSFGKSTLLYITPAYEHLARYYIQKNPNNPMGSPMKIRTIFCYARSYSTTSSADQKKKIAAGAEIFAGD